jgi:hypothetical protein
MPAQTRLLQETHPENPEPSLLQHKANPNVPNSFASPDCLQSPRWKELLAGYELARLSHRIETDRHGHILMSPPPTPAHGSKQIKIGRLLKALLLDGEPISECSILTSDGVKLTDVAWLKPGRPEDINSVPCLIMAPEICVEILPLLAPKKSKENVRSVSKPALKKSGSATTPAISSSSILPDHFHLFFPKNRIAFDFLQRQPLPPFRTAPLTRNSPQKNVLPTQHTETFR